MPKHLQRDLDFLKQKILEIGVLVGEDVGDRLAAAAGPSQLGAQAEDLHAVGGLERSRLQEHGLQGYAVQGRLVERALELLLGDEALGVHDRVESEVGALSLARHDRPSPAGLGTPRG